MICTVSLVEVGEDFWTYQVMYDGLKFERDYDLPFIAMSCLEKERFMAEMLSMPFNFQRTKALDNRPAEIVEDVLGINLNDTDSDDDDEFEPEEGVGPYIVKLLEDLKDRIENLEIKVNKSSNKDDTK